MPRDARAFLWDAKSSAERIRGFVRSRTLDDYVAEPTLAQQIPELRQLVGFRNLLIHGYAAVDHPTVWRTVQEQLPQLHTRIDQMLAELGEKP